MGGADVCGCSEVDVGHGAAHNMVQYEATVQGRARVVVICVSAVPQAGGSVVSRQLTVRGRVIC
jgi:hypothetical protein